MNMKKKWQDYCFFNSYCKENTSTIVGIISERKLLETHGTSPMYIDADFQNFD